MIIDGDGVKIGRCCGCRSSHLPYRNAMGISRITLQNILSSAVSGDIGVMVITSEEVWRFSDVGCFVFYPLAHIRYDYAESRSAHVITYLTFTCTYVLHMRSCDAKRSWPIDVPHRRLNTTCWTTSTTRLELYLSRGNGIGPRIEKMRGCPKIKPARRSYSSIASSTLMRSRLSMMLISLQRFSI